jgi:hypothetical protein
MHRPGRAHRVRSHAKSPHAARHATPRHGRRSRREGVETAFFPPSEAYRALNPLGSVPFLEDEGGVAINEPVVLSARRIIRSPVRAIVLPDAPAIVT